jgi:(2R)-sulfolactate sulfo-lyase subunit alpha
MAHAILIHEKDDDVGVAVKDLKKGEEVGVVTLEGEFVTTVKLADDVPLGHKVAMRALAEGSQVTEYSRTIGQATQAVAPGAHVHVHNIKTLRWSK